MKPTPMTDDQIQNAVKYALTDAVDFCDSEIADDRIRAQRYFDGDVDLDHEEGRSTVVATKVRDTIRMVKPVLMRTFLQADKPVEFVPRKPQDVAAAEQATEYVSYKFNECDGYSVLTDVFHDALVKKVGVAKVWWDETEDVEIDHYSNLVPAQIQMLMAEDGVEVLEQEEKPGPIDPMTGQATPLLDVKVALTKRRGSLKVKSIPPEDFYVDAGATDLSDAFIVADRAEMRVGDLVEMGFDFDEVYELAGTDSETVDEEEDFVRKGWTDEWRDEEINDPSMRKIVVFEVYMRMDVEGTGVPRLYQFTCAGTGYKVLDYKLADQKPYAVFEIDPEPHAFFGRSLADIVMEDQTASTSLLRGLLDNVHMSNNPRLVVNEREGYVEDAMNGEIGAILRAKGDTSSAYLPLVTPFTAAQTLPALQYYDVAIESKTGVSRSTLGMDADALQSTTAAGVNAAVQAGSAAAELMARNLAEGGFRQLFRLMLTLVRQHSDPQEVMRVNGSFVPVDPRSWSSSMDLVTNVGLGTGKHDERMAMLQSTLQTQATILQQYGMQNGLVTLTNVRHTLEDLLRLAGISNADRYFRPMTPEIEMQMQQAAAQAAQQQQGAGDPQAQAFMQAEGMKAQIRAQAEQMKHQRELTEMQMDDDRKRDQMEQDAVGKYGPEMAAYIRQLQAQPRY